MNRDFRCSAIRLREKLSGYFSECEEQGRKPTAYGLCLAADITPERMMELLRSGEGAASTQPEHLKELKRAQMRLCDYVEQLSDSMSVLKVKQPLYCGYSDKPTQQSDTPTVIVKMDATATAAGE